MQQIDIVFERMLTYMATLSELEKRNEIFRIDVELDPGVMPWRRLFGTPEFIDWLRDDLPALATSVIGGDWTPEEQVDYIFFQYVSGERLDQNTEFKKLSHNPDWHVWEFKTPDIRIFGWIPETDVFICTFGDLKDDIEIYRKYGRYMAQTQYWRDNFDLDEPKFVSGRNYNDVLSDAT